MIGVWGSASRDLFNILDFWSCDLSHHWLIAFAIIEPCVACLEDELRFLDPETAELHRFPG